MGRTHEPGHRRLHSQDPAIADSTSRCRPGSSDAWLHSELRCGARSHQCSRSRRSGTVVYHPRSGLIFRIPCPVRTVARLNCLGPCPDDKRSQGRPPSGRFWHNRIPLRRPKTTPQFSCHSDRLHRKAAYRAVRSFERARLRWRPCYWPWRAEWRSIGRLRKWAAQAETRSLHSFRIGFSDRPPGHRVIQAAIGNVEIFGNVPEKLLAQERGVAELLRLAAVESAVSPGGCCSQL